MWDNPRRIITEHRGGYPMATIGLELMGPQTPATGEPDAPPDTGRATLSVPYSPGSGYPRSERTCSFS